MRYLKAFNEVNKLYGLIKQDTKNYLSYLMDSGYDITFSDDLRYHMVYISKKGNELINWVDIKDEVIPYIQMMSKNYHLETIESRGTSMGSTFLKTLYLDKDDLIESSIKFITLSLAFKKKAKKLTESNLSESLDNTLYVFDFDDTLVNTPRFEDLVIEYLKENAAIKDIINSCVSDIGINISDLKWENGRVFVDDINKDIDIPNGINWIRKGSRVYLISPEDFGLTKISMPNAPLEEMIELYNSVENKCIVTARSERVRYDVELIIKKYNMEYPKYGIHMYPFNKHYQTGYWKGKTIVGICKENGFNSAIFYDDNAKYIKGAIKAVNDLNPNLNFKTVKV